MCAVAVNIACLRPRLAAVVSEAAALADEGAWAASGRVGPVRARRAAVGNRRAVCFRAAQPRLAAVVRERPGPVPPSPHIRMWRFPIRQGRSDPPSVLHSTHQHVSAAKA